MQQSMTFNEIAARWLAHKRHQVKESTFATYQYCVTKQLSPAFGEMREVTEDTVQSFATEWLRSGLSPCTVKERVNVLRQVVKYGAKQGLMPVVSWDIRYVSRRAVRPVAVLSADDQATLFRHVRSELSPRNLGIYISLTTGLRIGEVCGLRWGDLCRERSCISIRRTVERISSTEPGMARTCVVCSTPKTAHSGRDIPMSDELWRMAQAVRNGARAECYVLTGRRRPMEPRTYRHYFKQLLLSLHIQPIRFHALRHSFATRCIEGGCDCKTVSEILGHANVSITLNLYTHPNMERKRNVINQMVETLSRASK